MKSNRVINAMIALVVALPILSIVYALLVTPASRFSWQALAQDAYSGPVPPQVGIAPSHTNALVDPLDDGGISIVSYGVDGISPTSLYISPEDLAALPDEPGRNTLVDQTADGYVKIYKLTTGEYQANIGPDGEGKIFVYVFTFDPVTCVSRYEMSVSDPTPRFQGPC